MRKRIIQLKTQINVNIKSFFFIVILFFFQINNKLLVQFRRLNLNIEKTN